MPRPLPHHRPGRILWGTLAFLLGFSLLIVIIADWYLLPAFEAARDANTVERKTLSAHARLLLAVVLFILVAGVLLTFRFGRFFLPRRHGPVDATTAPTRYPDAWAESGRRMPTPPADHE